MSRFRRLVRAWSEPPSPVVVIKTMSSEDSRELAKAIHEMLIRRKREGGTPLGLS